MTDATDETTDVPRAVTVVLTGLGFLTPDARRVLATHGRLTTDEVAAASTPGRLPQVYSVEEARRLADALVDAGVELQIEQSDLEQRTMPDEAPQDVIGHPGVHERY